MVNMLALVIACLSLAWISVAVRFWVKIFVIGRVRWDDWILLMAVVLFSGQCGCVLTMTTATPSSNLVSYMFIASYNLSILTSVCVKTSFALSLNRFFGERWQRLLVTCLTLTYYLFATTEIFLDLFFCGPPSNLTGKDSLRQCKHWSDMLVWWLCATIFNSVACWIYILLPAAVVWTSNLSLKVKFAISLITMVGVVSGTATILRVLGSGSFTKLREFNPTNITVIACAVLEMAFSIIATSMTNSTQLPVMLARSKSRAVGMTTVDETCLKGTTPDMSKLPPIINQQKCGADASWDFAQTLEGDTLASIGAHSLHVPKSKTKGSCWSQTFDAPKIPAPARLTLLIDDISDDEDDCGMMTMSVG
ncbi:hypothetical protein AUEXF2481DRAFT_6580 [Aureobasidium subglaciale EXF-2481]|uniref:Rhodopsin domain-containing protein n=1 Tax=Aureobasidium subglaciale (strain EXF-2481) TaxID=1043005 RepID=A0A074YHD2_AURSE|nr:uncharacterized protein AUEXF2481DRAFT_6580 [Aureobasidium subglaciale EXF-2481]KAI5212870.1 hypothetical protein E4T38_00183 [Aureobasidium subglaciale]KAI5232351.1 hypothetical protein E4T40_00182 [Aureobasidium subglaciale]KAI5234674.1 hypothetical protein E4T41_00182 [Aureobasidium subglaciale]KAI5268441.1 hypothetical protein E4T46_00182 [Aureobasidium subglaciale]KEQ93502.1 hypothetical protein AUEXF2481DRAFT_6580 [Aureobasidium subglaciale EXF-2481]